jgi:aryl-alcohol dehydrogenase-like predicted oxidoreductase
MDFRTLGATGITVSPLCLGTMMFGAVGNPDHDEGVRIVHRALDAGINFIDTADAYSRGESEEIVGKAIQGRRDSLVIATKFYTKMSDTDPNMRGASRRWIVREVENSLRRLGTDYIDLYQLHRYDIDTDMEEVLFTLTDLVRAGKIRQFGASSLPADRIVESHWIAEKRGTMRLRTEQPPYSIFNRDVERFVLPACRRYGMGVLSYSPLDGGFLAGKYRGPEDFSGPNNRIERFARFSRGSFDPNADYIRRKIALVAELTRIADELGVGLAELAVAFVLQHPAITSAIIGPRTMQHLESVLGGGDLRLSPETLDRIDALCPPGTMFDPVNDLPSGSTRSALRR